MLMGTPAAVQFYGRRSPWRAAGLPLAIFSMTSAVSAWGSTPRGLPFHNVHDMFHMPVPVKANDGAAQNDRINR